MKFSPYFPLLIVLALASCRTAPETTPVPTTVEGYKKFVEDRLGQRWYRLAEANGVFLAVGTVETSFEIPAAGGRVRNLRIVSNTGNRTDEMIARGAIGHVRAPPVPPAISAILQREHKDYLLFEESFTIFDNAKPIPSPTPPKKR